MTATILTACYGGYDTLHPQVEQDIDVDWVVFTDDPAIDVPAPWRRVVAPGRYDHPRMSAKWFKFLPWLAVEGDRSIWVDANTEVTSPAFAREAFASMHDGIALFAHPQRSCIYDEAEASLRLAPAKYGHLPITEQVEHYRHNDHHPRKAGLYACGTIARDQTQRKIRHLGWQWLLECETWTYQDQLSFPVLCHRLHITPGVFPHRQISRHHLGNPWLTIHPHLSER